MSTSTRSLGPRRPEHPRTLRYRGTIAVMLATLALCAFVPSTASADDVDSLNAQADRIARQLDTLQEQLSQLGEKFNQSQVRQSQIAQRKIDIERRSASARQQVARRRADASHYALAAYVGIDRGDTLALALDGRQWELNRRSGYAAIRIGDREQIVDNLQAAQKRNDDLLASLAQANKAEDQVMADLDAQQRQATALMAQSERLQASVKGKLATAVAQRQAALAAAQAARPSTPNTTTTPGQPNATTATSVASGTPTTTVANGPATTTVGNQPGGPTTTTAPPVTAPPVVTPPPVTTPPVTPPASGGRGQIAANAAISQLGVRYSWGGGTASGPSYGFGPGAGIKGFDCSGLTLYAWAQAGVSLYHSAQMQYDASTHISLSQLRPGDLLFFGSSSTSIDHVAIYIGGGQIIHAPNHTTVVQYAPVNLWPGYFGWRGAGRPG